MFIFENDRNEIHDVDSTTDTNLHAVEVTDGTFDNWSKARICCYVADVREGRVVTLYPYVNTIIVEQLDRLGVSEESNEKNITDVELGVCDLYETADKVTTENQDQITNLELAVCDLYESIGG